MRAPHRDPAINLAEALVDDHDDTVRSLVIFAEDLADLLAQAEQSRLTRAEVQA